MIDFDAPAPMCNYDVQDGEQLENGEFVPPVPVGHPGVYEGEHPEGAEDGEHPGGPEGDAEGLPGVDP